VLDHETHEAIPAGDAGAAAAQLIC
jgi:hypothetical protein